MMYFNINESGYSHHALVFYKNNDDLNDIIIKYINKGLENDILCIYGLLCPYNIQNNSNLSVISARILNYMKHINNGNLIFINTNKYYEYAIRRNVKQFNTLKVELQKALTRREIDGKRKEILFISDIASSLLREKKVGQCFEFEEWWTCQAHLKFVHNKEHITTLCLYHNSLMHIFEGFEKIIKDKLISLHTITIDFNE